MENNISQPGSIPRYLIFLLAVLYLVGLTSCASVEENRRQNKIKVFANEFFQTLVSPTQENQELWDMETFNIYGYGVIPFFEIPIASPGIRINKSPDSLQVYEVVQSLWIEGVDDNGEGVKLKRKLHYMLLTSEDETQWQVLRTWYSDDQPLSTWEQAGRWAFWSFLGPLLLAFGIVGIFVSNLLPNINLLGCMRIIAMVVALPLVGYASLVFFGSVEAVLIGLAIYLVIAFLIFAIIQRFLRSSR